MQATQRVAFGFSEDNQAVPALWEEVGHRSRLTGRQGCIPSSRLCLIMSLVAALEESHKSRSPCSCCCYETPARNTGRGAEPWSDLDQNSGWSSHSAAFAWLPLRLASNRQRLEWKVEPRIVEIKINFLTVKHFEKRKMLTPLLHENTKHIKS